MNRFYLTKAFKEPIDYEIPPNEALEFDTEHPELNSQAYCYKASKYRQPNDYLPIYSSIRQNEHGLFIIATNEFTTCVNNAILAGDYEFNNFVSSDFKSAKFSAAFQDTLLDLHFLDDIMFLSSTASNQLELYSTKALVTLEQENHHDVFCFIKVAYKSTDGRVKCISKFNDSKRFILGTSNGHIECYEYDTKELFQSFFMAYGHSAEITGISAHPSIDLNWVSTSADKTCLLWDRRLLHPALALLENHHDQLTAVKWINDEIVILSDAVGNLMVFDTRNIQVPLSKINFINRPIISLNFHKSNKQFGVISESCKALIYEIDDKNELKQIHEHNAHPKMLYSLCFDAQKPNTYYVVGEKKYAKEVTFTQE